MCPKKASQYATAMTMTCLLRSFAAKWVRPGRFTRILLPITHLLQKGLSLLLICKRQTSQTVLRLECMEKGPVLVVREAFVDFLVPYNSSVGRRNIHQLDPVCISHQVVGEHSCSLQPCVNPFRWIWICNVETSYGNGLYFVGCFRHLALHNLLVVFGEDGRHAER